MEIFRDIETDATIGLSVQEMETLNRLLTNICMNLQENGRRYTYEQK